MTGVQTCALPIYLRLLELADRIAGTEGIGRKGLILSFLMRLKQICNHPSQWLGDGAWDEADSGKFTRLREIAEVIADKQEKVLLFSQFKETAAPLAARLGRQPFVEDRFGELRVGALGGLCRGRDRRAVDRKSVV